MGAKESLLGTLAVFRDCLNDPALIDRAPADVAHNSRAGMLRQGLAVLVFSTLEAFVRERTAELLLTFDNAVLTFADLSPALQKASTIGALEGVRFRMRLQPASSKVTWLTGALGPISTATTDVSNLSAYSFGHSTSNLGEDDVVDILKAFGIDSPWTQITQLTRRFGMAIPDCESDFIAIKERRHSSAHALTASVLYNDLSNSVRSALAICLAFDLLISNSRSLFNTGAGPKQNSRPAMSQDAVNLIFVEPRIGTTKFNVRKEQLPPPAPLLLRKTIRILPDKVTAISSATNYALSRRFHVVVHDATGTPVDWMVS